MKKLIMVVVFLILSVGPGMSQALDQAVLKWTNPTLRSDSTTFNPVTEQKGVDVFYGTTSPPTTVIHVIFSGTYPAVVSGQTYTVTGLNPATTYYFGVRAVDFFNQVGAMSNIVSKVTATPVMPAGCTNLTVQ